MSNKHLIDFNLEIALKEPERVYLNEYIVKSVRILSELNSDYQVLVITTDDSIWWANSKGELLINSFGSKLLKLTTPTREHWVNIYKITSKPSIFTTTSVFSYEDAILEREKYQEMQWIGEPILIHTEILDATQTTNEQT